MEKFQVVLAKIKLRRRLYFLFVLIFILVVGVFFLVGFVGRFLDLSGTNFKEVKQKIKIGLERQDEFKGKRVNFLILSLDKRNDKLESTLLTDTIIFASLDTKTARLQLIPIPRDLWVDSLKTKINALYYYGEEKGTITGETNGPEYLMQELSSILGQPMSFWLAMDYPDLAELVDAMGGVEVMVEKSFKDEEFPNPEYVKATESGAPVFITIKFNEGLELMNGERSLQFVRSRKSEDIEAGTDIARSDRQLILFQALLSRIKSKAVLADPAKLAALYRFWQEKVDRNVRDEDLVGIGIGNKEALKGGIVVSSVGIPSTLDSMGEILVHPPINKYKQWVFEPRDPSWKELREFVTKTLE